MSAITIGKAAAQAGVRIDTVRYYEKVGLLRRARRSAGGYRHYSEEDVARLQFIRRAKHLGFSLEEIAALLAISEAAGDRRTVKALAERRLAEVEAKLAALAALRETLSTLVARCSGHGPIEGCPIFESIGAADCTDSPGHVPRRRQPRTEARADGRRRVLESNR
jgi:MerR family transcriptional regulator, copper efflux regulator